MTKPAELHDGPDDTEDIELGRTIDIKKAEIIESGPDTMKEWGMLPDGTFAPPDMNSKEFRTAWAEHESNQ